MCGMLDRGQYPLEIVSNNFHSGPALCFEAKIVFSTLFFLNKCSFNGNSTRNITAILHEKKLANHVLV
jgi:hypothetical protein